MMYIFCSHLTARQAHRPSHFNAKARLHFKTAQGTTIETVVLLDEKLEIRLLSLQSSTVLKLRLYEKVLRDAIHNAELLRKGKCSVLAQLCFIYFLFFRG